MLEIHYRTNKLKKVCTNLIFATKEYGIEMADKIHIRIDQIKAADSVSELVRGKIGRCHPLHGDRQGQYSMDLVHPYRLVFIEEDEETVSVRIERIEDYH